LTARSNKTTQNPQNTSSGVRVHVKMLPRSNFVIA
jgi:hypothetical protein